MSVNNFQCHRPNGGRHSRAIQKNNRWIPLELPFGNSGYDGLLGFGLAFIFNASGVQARYGLINLGFMHPRRALAPLSENKSGAFKLLNIITEHTRRAFTPLSVFKKRRALYFAQGGKPPTRALKLEITQNHTPPYKTTERKEGSGFSYDISKR